MPYAEPNQLPENFDTWEQWRESYRGVVATFLATNKSTGDELYLKILLKKLGFSGVGLEAELTYVKGN